MSFTWAAMSVYFRLLHLPPPGLKWGPVRTASKVAFCPMRRSLRLGFSTPAGRNCCALPPMAGACGKFTLFSAPDFQITVSNTPLTVFVGSPATFNGAVTTGNGYDYPVTLRCTTGSSSPPVPCTPAPVSVIPTSPGTAFSLTAGTSTVADYSFYVQGVGSDPNNLTHAAALTLNVVDLAPTTPSPSTVTDPRGAASAPVSFQVEAQGSFHQSVTVSCSISPTISGATCALTPGTVVNPTAASPVNMTATVIVPAGTTTGNYTATLQATTAGAPVPLTTSYAVAVTLDPEFSPREPSAFPKVKIGSSGTAGPILISSQDGFSGTVALSCLSTFGENSCSVSPASVSTFPATVSLIINGTSFNGGSYQVAVQGT
jgi:hypothetical protein